jgi:hypothetical protein
VSVNWSLDSEFASEPTQEHDKRIAVAIERGTGGLAISRSFERTLLCPLENCGIYLRALPRSRIAS